MLTRVIHNKKVSLINTDEIVKIDYVSSSHEDHEKDEMSIHYTNGTVDKLKFDSPEELETILKKLNPNPKKPKYDISYPRNPQEGYTDRTYQED